MRACHPTKDGVAVTEIDPNDLDFVALAAMNFQPFCECPEPQPGCCLRALYFEGRTVDSSSTVVEQDGERFYILRSPVTVPGYYVMASGDPRESAPAYFRPGSKPRSQVKGQVFMDGYMVYDLPPQLRAA